MMIYRPEKELADLVPPLMANILALDQSSKVSGYSIFKNGELYQYGKFKFDDSDIGERLCKIRNKIIELIEEHGIDEIVFEDVQLQESVDTFKVLSEVLGVINELCSELNIPYRTYLASSWRAELKIKGKARIEQKRSAQEFVINTYNIKCTQDEADAICIGTCDIRKNR